MHNLSPLTALGRQDARIDVVANTTLTEVPGVALASVAARLGKERQTKTALKKLSGETAPEPMRFSEGKMTIFWAGPDQYMVEAPIETHEELAAQVIAVTKANASVTEQTDGWVRFDLSGDELTPIMELLSALDLRQMSQGAAQRSSIHHLGCFILRRREDCFSIYGPRASAGSLHHAILAAMRSIA